MTATVIDYPATLGYGSWSARLRHAGDSEVREALHVADPYQSQIGEVRWEGTLTTPRLARLDSRWVTVRKMIDALEGGLHRLRLTLPSEWRYTDTGTLSSATSLVVQPLHILGAPRNARGVEEGWTIEWVEAPA